MKSKVENMAQMHDAAAEAAGLLKAMANPDRLLILCHLADGEKNVGALQDLLGLRQPAISQQLSRLRFEKLVESHRSGKTISYRLCSAEVAQVIGLLYELYCAPKSGRRRSRGKQGRKKKPRSLTASMGASGT